MKLNNAVRGNELQGFSESYQLRLVVSATRRKTTVAFKDTPTYLDNSAPPTNAGRFSVATGSAIWVD